MSTGEQGAGAGGRRQSANAGKRPNRQRGGGARKPHRYAALDLGTNNCRLLIAAPEGRELRIIDAFSRIVRLGEGLSASGVLSDPAMARTLEALQVCAEKIARRGVTHMRCIATQACRSAANGLDFLKAIRDRTGLELEIITTEEEARLAAAGCMDLIAADAPAAMIFDIGGGSTEISWVRRNGETGVCDVPAWTSMPFGVVTLAEKWGGRDISAETYEAMVEDIRMAVKAFGDPAGLKPAFESDKAHLLGTSGTVTSIAGVYLKLERYRRDRIDGVWLELRAAREVTERLRMLSFAERAAEPCIGHDRADLVVCGCAILEALAREWPATRIRVADRGLREGILADLARAARKRGRRPKRNPKRNRGGKR